MIRKYIIPVVIEQVDLKRLLPRLSLDSRIDECNLIDRVVNVSNGGI
jgi:hypothetical protein